MNIDYKRKQILVVDDFPEMRSSLRRMLENYGAQNIIESRSGKEAMGHIEKKAFDLILCDYNLGEGKNGQQILEEAKQRGFLQYTTVFMMITAETTVSMVMGAMEHEPDGYLTKPFNKSVLKARLDKLIEKKAEFAAVEQAMKNENYPKILALCDDQIQKESKYKLDFLRIKSDVLLKTGEFKKVAELFQSLITLHNIPWAKLGLGRIYYNNKDFLQAKDSFQALVQEHKNYIPGYDWLAKTLEAMENLEEAKTVLRTALDLSPNALMRHKQLADIAYKSQDLDLTEKSLRAVVKYGKNSCYKSTQHYSQLAKVMSENNNSLEALKLIHEAQKEFGNDQQSCLEFTITQSVVYKNMGKETESKQSLGEAIKIVNGMTSKMAINTCLDFAKLCFELGNDAKGQELMQSMIRENIENEDIMNKAQKLYATVGKNDEGSALIADIKSQVDHINREGVRLATEGKLEEAINLFEKALKGLPNNMAISLNVAQALLLHLQKNGKQEIMLAKASNYLNKVKEINPANTRFQQLFTMYKQVAGGN